jgi:hypothetical protein
MSFDADSELETMLGAALTVVGVTEANVAMIIRMWRGVRDLLKEVDMFR